MRALAIADSKACLLLSQTRQVLWAPLFARSLCLRGDGSTHAPPAAPVHFRCTIQYDGSGFHGYQSQSAHQGVRTVQECIENALRELNCGDPVRVVAAGRTDKGVHASGQVVNFSLPRWKHGTESMLRALNAKLPKDVSAVDSKQVGPSFHARYSASFRRYRYSVYNAPHRSPLLSQYAWHVAEHLDTDQMQRAADLLLGTHDFSTFGSPPDGEGHCIREIISIKIDRSPAPDAGPGPFSSASTPSASPVSGSSSADAGTLPGGASGSSSCSDLVWCVCVRACV